MTPADFRRLALALPEVVEGEHHGHADFRAHGRVFASLHPDGVQAMVKVPPTRQRELLAMPGAPCKPASGAWGRAGCTMLVLATVGAEVVQAALQDAWQFAAASGGMRRAAKPKRVAKPKTAPTPKRTR